MNDIKYGIVSRSFSNMPVLDAARKMQSFGYAYTELCFTHDDLPGWNYNGYSDYEALGVDEKLVCEKARIFRDHGIEITALGVFSNLVTPEEDLWEKCKKFYLRSIEFAAAAKIPAISTECGFRSEYRGLTTDNYESDFTRLKERTAELARFAHGLGVKIAMEACVIDVINSPKRLRDFILQVKDEYGLDNIGVLLDPANFIAAADEDDMFKYLAEHVIYLHGKDRKVNDTYGRILGDGDIDWPRFFKNYYKHTPDKPFIIEYTTEATAELTNDRVRAFSKR